jgi:DNA topoisomerase III
MYLLTLMQRSIQGNQYVKNYEFDFAFGAPWGNCQVTMTSVLGHITGNDFTEQHRRWMSCPPGALFDAPITDYVVEVRVCRAKFGTFD